MRNEIWSLIYHRGAPFWYITISPADIKHPLCVYYADNKEKFSAEILPYDAHLRLICQNPVAGARFFDFMVQVFITDILGVGTKQGGIYGDVPAYYGTVEQQGQLTLHLHILIWLRGNLTPHELRQKILDPDSTWKMKLINWLESCHVGEFLTGSQDEVLSNVAEQSTSNSYKNPTEMLPQNAPPTCHLDHDNNEAFTDCNDCKKWWSHFEHTVDDIVENASKCCCNSLQML